MRCAWIDFIRLLSLVPLKSTRFVETFWRRREHKTRPIKYLTNKSLEAAGVDLPRSSHSRMISKRRWAQSARNDRKPWCRYKSGTGNPPASALFRHHPLNVRVRTCRTGQRSNAGEEARSSRTAALGQLHRSTRPARSSSCGRGPASHRSVLVVSISARLHPSASPEPV
jgi:hypothetical protein